MVNKKNRLTSLDVFRGITIAGMILVNNPGSWNHVYPPLLHAEWHGWTPTDLIFPFFLFIVGVAMVFSFGKLQQKGISKIELYTKVLKRTIILFALGIFMHNFPFVTFDPLSFIDFTKIRIMGILQRIALAYLVSAILLIEFKKPVVHASWAIGILIFYWLAMVHIPVPGFGAGDLSKEGNLVAYIDTMIMPNNLWQPGWDPEGLFSTIPAVATVLMGVLTGHLLKSTYSRKDKTIYMFVAANIIVVAGLISDAWFPINKGLWTSSYVLFTGGVALHFLALVYWLIEIKDIKKWSKPFVIYGMNALAVFVLSSLMAKLLFLVPINTSSGQTSIKAIIYEQFLLPIAGPLPASLLFALLYVLFWLWMMWILYKREIFIKI